MPSATWNSGGSNDMNDTSNYTAVWDGTFDLVWDATSVVDCAATAPVACNSITVAAAYTGAWSISGQDLTVAAGASWDGTGTLNLGNGLTANGASSTVHVGSGVGSVTASSCVLTLNGTTAMVFDNDKASVLWRRWIIGNNAVVTNTSGTQQLIRCASAETFLTIGTSATLTNNSALYFAYGTATGHYAWSMGAGATFNGTGLITVANYNLSAALVYIPALAYTGSGAINIVSSSSASSNEIRFTGNLTSAADVNLYLQNSSALYSYTINVNGFDISCANLNYGANGAFLSNNIINFGSGTITCTLSDGSYIAAPVDINFQTSQWSCSGNWTYGSNHIVDPGTSQVTITNTSTITSNGSSFYGLIINAAGRVITLADSLTIADAGTLWVAAFTSFAGNQYVIFAGSGGITIQTNVSNRLRTAAGGSTIVWNTGVNVWTFPAYTDGDFGGAGPGLAIWRSTAAGTPFYIAAPAATINVSYMDFTDANNAAGGTIYALDGTSVDNGGNVNILFPSPLAQTGNSNSAISIPIGI